MKKYVNKNSCSDMVKITYLRVGGCEQSSTFGKICEEIQDVDLNIEFTSFESEDTIRDPIEFRELISSSKSSNILIINVHGDVSGYKKYDDLKKILQDENIDTVLFCLMEETMAENRHLFKHSDREYLTLRTYLQLGGSQNRRSFILYLCKIFKHDWINIPEPVKNRTQGIYHPDFSKEITAEDYFKTLDPKKPTVGIMISQNVWINDKLEPYDLLIHSIENMGANTIPVFYITTPSDISGSIGAIKTIDVFFKDGSISRVGSIIITQPFSQLTLANPTDGSQRGNTFNFFQDLNVPALQAIPIFRSQETWKNDGIGMEGGELAICIAMPECDGQLTTVPFVFSEKDKNNKEYNSFIKERIERIAGMAVEWSKVGRVPVSKRKVSILVNGSPMTNASLGSAGGLDSFASICNLLHKMADAGYVIDRIPENGQQIIDEMLNALTTDLEWNSEQEIPKKAIALLENEKYCTWLNDIPKNSKEWICRNWGDPPGEIMSQNGKFIIPGVMNGNIYLGIEPNRGKHDKAEEMIHDPDISTPHSYLAYYRWIARVLKPDIHIHIGTHGSAEWLPGKGNGLSEECFPDIMMFNTPNLYVYVIDDPSEGIVAKRRKKSVLVDHLMPSLRRADTYDDLMDLEAHIQDYLFSKQTMQPEKMNTIGDSIYDIIKKLSMWKELKLEPDASKKEVMSKCELIYDYVSDLKDGLITDGLHILGHVPDGRHMEEMIYCLTRLNNGKMPSLRKSIANSMNFNLDELMDNISSINASTREVNGTIVNRIDDRTQQLIYKMQDLEYDTEKCMNMACAEYPKNNEDVLNVTKYICNTIHPNILGISDELTNAMNGLEGGYVPPGPSGSPTRGNAHLLPTGKNYYSLDPESVPGESSWKAGMKMADEMIHHYVEEEGKYPETVGIVIWSIDTMKTGGDDVAYILYLLGVRPIWGSVGSKIIGLEIIPQKELERPRIDVTVRMSSLFRDTFPNLFQLIDEAVEMVADLDETDENNFIKKHLQQDIIEMIKEGMSPEDAKDESMIRVFGEPPGTHGAGVNILIESSKWDSIDDLAQIYISCGCSAYGRKWRGEKKPKLFRHRLDQLDVAVKNQVDREIDLLDIDDGYAYLGGMNAVIRSDGKEKPMNIIGDSSDPDRLKIRDLEGEIAYMMRTRILNPKWIEGLKDHGFVGANLIADNINHALGWDATSDVIEDWMYESMVNHFLLDENNRKWIENNNPYALKDMLSDLLEAINRELWEATDDMKSKLQEMYLDAEGLLEEMSSKDTSKL